MRLIEIFESNKVADFKRHKDRRDALKKSKQSYDADFEAQQMINKFASILDKNILKGMVPNNLSDALLRLYSNEKWLSALQSEQPLDKGLKDFILSFYNNAENIKNVIDSLHAIVQSAQSKWGNDMPEKIKDAVEYITNETDYLERTLTRIVAMVEE